jgi:hypothetical protein
MAKNGEVCEVSFKPAKGGVISETRTKMKRGGQGGGPDYDYKTENGVHPSMEHASAHLKSTLGHSFTDTEAEENAEANPPK